MLGCNDLVFLMLCNLLNNTNLFGSGELYASFALVLREVELSCLPGSLHSVRIKRKFSFSSN